MSDLILRLGDRVQFEPMFGPRQVTVIGPVLMPASGHASVDHRPMCVLGDELKVQAPATYTLPGYSPGTGLVAIVQLGPDQRAPQCLSRGIVLLKGQNFIARFTPLVLAVATAGGTPDVATPTPGRGRFETTQAFARAG